MPPPLAPIEAWMAAPPWAVLPESVTALSVSVPWLKIAPPIPAPPPPPFESPPSASPPRKLRCFSARLPAPGEV